MMKQNIKYSIVNKSYNFYHLIQNFHKVYYVVNCLNRFHQKYFQNSRISFARLANVMLKLAYVYDEIF